MAAILLTGATGTVGSSLVPLLVGRGHRLICLVRGENPAERLARAIGYAPGVEVVRGDVVMPAFGISNDELRRLRGRVDSVFHCASSIKFDEALKEEITAVNVRGTANALVLARHLKVREFHYVSTAYVAGNADVFRESDFHVGQTRRNVYERTKLEAEYLVLRWHSDGCGKSSIYRLGIVVGDTVTGHTDSFNGFYVFASRYQELREICLREIELGSLEGKEIKREPNGALRLPIRGRFSPISTLNLVPIDWAVRSLADLTEIPARGLVFHVTHPSPSRIKWQNEILLRLSGITGFRYDPLPEGYVSDTFLGRLQRIFDRGTKPYIPYTTHEARFIVENMPKVLGSRYVEPPPIDEDFLTRIVSYARRVNFGRQRVERKAVI